MAATESASQESDVHIRVNGPKECLDSTGILRVVSEDGTTARLPLRVESTLRLSPEETYLLKPEHGACWARETVVVPTAPASEVRLELVPAGEIAGRWVVPRGALRPERFFLTFEPARPFRLQRGSVAGSIPRATESCPVDDKGGWRCGVPAGRLDLRLHSPGYVSHYRWGLEVGEKGLADVGTVELEPGASMFGWVRTGDGSPLLPGAEAALVPLAAGRPIETESAGIGRLRQRVPVEPRGFFHFRDLTPGSYRLKVTAEGFADASLEPVEILEGREAELAEPVVLERPVSFQIALVPPVNPYGRGWSVALSPVEGSAAKPDFRPAEVDGTVAWEGLAPREYRLEVESGRGRYRHRWWSETIEVESSMPVVEIRLPLVEIEGRVLLGREPVEALLRFGGRNAPRQIDLDSGEDGRFAGYLTEEGRWPLSVLTRETGWRSLPPVDVELLPNDRLAELEIVIPDTTLEGRVEDAEGRPQEKVEVRAFHLDRRLQLDSTETDSEGSFLLRGLAPGRILLSAQAVDGSSESASVLVDLEEDGPAPAPVTLVLARRVLLRGRVVSPVGGVPGARVLVSPRASAYRLGTRPTTLTGPDGRFEVQVPEDTPGLDLVVLPPGFAARLLHVAGVPEGDLEIDVHGAGGTLVLDLGSFAVDGRPSEPGTTIGDPLLLHDGARASLRSFHSWTRLHGTEAPEDRRMVLPEVSPGEYALCVPRGVFGQGEGQECVRGVLAPQGHLSLAREEER